MKRSTVYLIIIILILGITTIIYLQKSVTNTSKNQYSTKQEQPDNVKAPVIDNWKKYSIERIGLSFSAPSDMTVDEDQSDNNILTFSVQRGVYPNPNYYQLYASLQPTGNMDSDAEGLKSQLLDGSKDTIIGGFQAIQGQYKGERNRYVTFIFTDKGILTLATSQPTPENESITNSILDTFSFTRNGDKSFTSPTTEKAIQAVLAKKYNKQLNEVDVKVTKEVPGFAAGSVLFGQGGVGEGGMWIAVLGNDWEVVWDGNGNVDCDELRQKYGVPDSILKPAFCD